MDDEDNYHLYHKRISDGSCDQLSLPSQGSDDVSMVTSFVCNFFIKTH